MQTIKPYIDALHLAGADPIIWAAFGNMWCAKIMHKGETRWVISAFGTAIEHGDPGAMPQTDEPIKPMLAWFKARIAYEGYLLQIGQWYLDNLLDQFTAEHLASGDMATFIKENVS